MTTTPDQLPALDSVYALDEAQGRHFRELGHICLREVCSADEIEAYRPAIVAAAERFAEEKRPLAERDTYSKAFLQIMNLWERDEAVRRFVFARRFARIAAELLGVPAVRLYHDQALFKEPGGGYTPWHQDQFYWPLSTDNTITMWMPLRPAPVEAGAMAFASGSHTRGYLGDLGISDTSEQVFREMIIREGLPMATNELRPGDATFHYGWTLHKAPGNSLDYMREVMTIIYHAADATVTAPRNENQRMDIERWLPDCKPGDPAASRLNPVLYEAEGAS